MAKKILLTPHAREDLDNLVLYLFENWGVSVLENFLAIYEAKITVIAEYPERYPYLNQQIKIRKAVLTKHNIILYREKDDSVEIVSIFDTLQNPSNVNRLL